jgi:hypothetical protein
MKIQKVKLTTVKPNPENPRVIKDDKFRKLVKSIQDFPQMLEIRPIVVNEDMVVLGGNMRLRAASEAGLKEVHIIQASELTPQQQREFIIKDNVGFGEWDWETLANDWEEAELMEWGLDIPGFDTEGEVAGDIVELDQITTTFNVNIKCDNPEQVEELKFKLGITSNSIHITALIGLLA